MMIQSLENRVFLSSVTPSVVASTGPSLSAPAPASPSLLAAVASALRVDVGSNRAYTDPSGQVWSADMGYTGGSVSLGTGDVLGTTSDPLYLSRRWGNFSYSLPVSNGTYDLRMHFVDQASTQAGQRRFDVKAEGQVVQGALDIFSQVGKSKALITSNIVTIGDGKLDLVFTSLVSSAIVSAIELVPASAPVPSIAWSNLASAPIIRAEALRAVVDNKLYIFGGFSGEAGPVVRSDVYDTTTNKWTQIADLPMRLTHTGVTAVGRNVYFAGGFVGVRPGYQQVYGTKKVYRYNVDTNTFYSMPDLPIERAGGGLVEIAGKLHFFGGNNINRQDVADHYVLNLNGGTSWTTAAPMPNSRSHMAYIGLGGYIYAIAGQIGNDEELTTKANTDRYNPSTNTWTSLAPLPKSISHISSSISIWNGKIILAGGETAHGVFVADVYMYDVANNVWMRLNDLPAKRLSGAAGVINGVYYYTGGSSTTTTWKGVIS